MSTGQRTKTGVAPFVRQELGENSPATTPTNLDRALAEAGDGVFVIGDDGRIVLWNSAAEKILGYPARDVLGRPCYEVLAGRDEHDNRLCCEGCHVRTLVNLGEAVQSFDMRTTTQAGKPVWLNVSVLSMPPVTVHLFRDITAQHQLMDMVRERLGPKAPAPDDPDIGGALTRREIEILKLLGAGMDTRGVAQRLRVSPATIRNHVQKLLGKLGVHSRLEAVALAFRRNWL